MGVFKLAVGDLVGRELDQPEERPVVSLDDPADTLYIEVETDM